MDGQPIAISAFNRLSKNASSPGNSAYYCYADLVISSLVVADTITNTHCTYPQMTWLNTKVVYLQTVTHPSTNWALS